VQSNFFTKRTQFTCLRQAFAAAIAITNSAGTIETGDPRRFVDSLLVAIRFCPCAVKN